MKGRFFPVVALLAAASPADAPRMTEAEAGAVQLALDRGALIYAYDQAAWHGTDDFRAKAPAEVARAGGWIVDGPADAPELVFVTRDPEPRALYVADFRKGRLTASRRVDGEAATLTPTRRRMVAALAAARAAFGADKTAFACARQPFNTVVLPPATPDAAVAVYFLTPQTENGVFPLGGHYRADVDAAGHVAIRPFTKSCLPLRPQAPPGGKASGMVVSHLLDPTPTEVHVFASLTARLPVYVVTGERLWAVEGTRIRLLDKDKP